MMRKSLFIVELLSFILLLALFFGCQTAPEPVEVEEPAESEKVLPEEPEPEPEPEPAPEPEEEEFEVTEEIYKETFEDIEAVIKTLNGVIASEDYEQWLDYLTDAYKDYYSSDDILKRYTDLYKQKGYNYSIRTLKDYFDYVVVRSRQGVQLDEIEFMEAGRVKAYAVEGDRKILLYSLEKIDDIWKITI